MGRLDAQEVSHLRAFAGAVKDRRLSLAYSANAFHEKAGECQDCFSFSSLGEFFAFAPSRLTNAVIGNSLSAKRLDRKEEIKRPNS